MSSNEEKNDNSDDKDKSQDTSSNKQKDNSSDNNASKQNTEAADDKDESQGNQDDKDEGSKSAPPSGGRNITGPEKFVETGGSGGSKVEKSHGFEAMVHK
jgi:hypothetical protein